MEFGQGFVAGAANGAVGYAQGVASLITGLPGSLVQIFQGITALFSAVVNLDIEAAAAAAFPQLYAIYNMARNWTNMTAYQQGYAVGEFAGQYGAQALFAAGLATITAQIQRILPGTSNPGCFPPNTLVATETGLRPIGEIKAGERVWGFDFYTGTWRLSEVRSRNDRVYTGPMVNVDIGFCEITTTHFHPFWVLEGKDLEARPATEHVLKDQSRGLSLPGRWVNSHDLRVSDVVFLRGQRRATVVRVAAGETASNVCNLTVQDLHTFAVGEGGVLVHNGLPCNGQSGNGQIGNGQPSMPRGPGNAANPPPSGGRPTPAPNEIQFPNGRAPEPPPTIVPPMIGQLPMPTPTAPLPTSQYPGMQLPRGGDAGMHPPPVPRRPPPNN